MANARPAKPANAKPAKPKDASEAKPAKAQDLYKPFAKALEGISRPPAELHAGGPRARVLSGEQDLAFALCAACRTRIAHLTKPGDDAVLARLDELILSKKHIAYEVLWPAANALPYGTDGAKRAADDAESPAVQAARAWLGCHYGSQKCLPFVTKCLVRTLREVERTEGADAAATFAVELDELILRREFAAAYAAHVGADAPAIRRVLWRGADAKGRPAWWLVRIDDATYGLLGKLGVRWTWHADARAPIFATIPDEHLERAVDIATTRDV